MSGGLLSNIAWPAPLRSEEVVIQYEEVGNPGGTSQVPTCQAAQVRLDFELAAHPFLVQEESLLGRDERRGARKDEGAGQ